jgi:hypothetical protein
VQGPRIFARQSICRDRNLSHKITNPNLRVNVMAAPSWSRKVSRERNVFPINDFVAPQANPKSGMMTQ